MAEEKIYTIPLRREWQKVPIHKRTGKAIRATKQFLLKHLKQEVGLGPYLNEYIWKQGNKHPPARVKVRVEEEDKKLTAELINAPRKEKKVEKKESKEKIKAVNVDEKKEEKLKEKQELDKKAIENVPENKMLEKEERQDVKAANVKVSSQKKEKVIPKN